MSDGKRAKVRQKVADPETYRTRLGYQGGRDLDKRIQNSVTDLRVRDRWVRVDGKWRRMDVRNTVHRATATVHDGSIKALTTESLPENPSLAWFYQIDTNVLHDQRRKEGRDKAAMGAMAAGAIMDEKTRLPAQRAYTGHDHDPLDQALTEARYRPEAREPATASVRPTEHLNFGPPAPGGEQPPRYKPVVDSLTIRFGASDEDYSVDPRITTARREEAAETLEEARQRAGVDPATFELLRQHLAFGVSLRALQARAGVQKSQVNRRLGRAIDKLTAETKGSAADLVDKFKQASPEGGTK